jgi:uncharacterized damage-inducible protein DinB
MAYNFKLLAKYNKETNTKMNSIIKTISLEDWNRNFTGFYKSIHELCSHIYNSDSNCLARFKTVNNFNSLDNISGEKNIIYMIQYLAILKSIF